MIIVKLARYGIGGVVAILLLLATPFAYIFYPQISKNRLRILNVAKDFRTEVVPNLFKFRGREAMIVTRLAKYGIGGIAAIARKIRMFRRR